MRSLAPTLTRLLLCLPSACNAVRGFGHDLQRAGENVENAARQK